MNGKIACGIAFVVGAAAGSLVTWRLLKTKYEQIAQEEIDSVKLMYAKRLAEGDEIGCDEQDPEIETAEAETEEETDLKKYEKEISNQSYSNHSIVEAKNEQMSMTLEDDEPDKEESEDVDTPYIISPEEFGEDPGYDSVTLIYYADGVVTDDDNNVIEDEEADELFGLESLEHFGEYEDDSVHVRNDVLKTEYEILRDERDYEDVAASEIRPGDI